MFIVLFLVALVDFELWGVGLKSVTRPSSGIIHFRALCLHGTAPCIAEEISEVTQVVVIHQTSNVLVFSRRENDWAVVA